MKLEERRQDIIDRLIELGSVTLDELAQRYGVSKMTIHRDLDDLEAAGLLRKVRGGASVESSSRFESDYRYRERHMVEEKRRIARAAMELVEPGMTVLVNDGSTAAQLTDLLPDKRPLTVITNNMAVISGLAGLNGITLIALGGTYSKKFNGFFGIVAEESLARLRADIAFVSSSAVDGVTAFHQEHEIVRAKRLMIAAGSRVYLLVDHGKFGRTALHYMADLSEMDGVITGAPLAAPASRALADSGIRLIVAGQEKES